MSVADYLDWIRLSGFYLDPLSKLDSYRACAKLISPEGLHVFIVAEFLEDNSPAIDLQDWRNFYVSEPGGLASHRVELTASALDAIGAQRTATKMRQTKKKSGPSMQLMEQVESDPEKMLEMAEDLSPGDILKEFRKSVAHAFPEMAKEGGVDIDPPKPDAEIESREQIEHLLSTYASHHSSALEADIAKHGDPRSAPGFRSEERMQELERRHIVQKSHEEQKQHLDNLRGLMRKIESRLATGITVDKLAQERRQFARLVKKNRTRPDDELIPEMKELLVEAGQFQEEHATLFRPKVVDAPEQLARLAAIGDYSVDTKYGQTRIEWDAPIGLECSWTRFSLHMEFPQNQPQSVAALLDAMDHLKQRLDELTDDWREQIIDHFQAREDWDDWFEDMDDYEQEDDDEIDVEETGILKLAGEGSIHLTAMAESVGINGYTFFPIEWDDEHGLELFWEDEQLLDESDATFDVTTVLAKLRFSESGPALTKAEIDQIEQRYSIRLPDAYCEFLLTHNGGVPKPNQMNLSKHGVTIPIDVECFFSITGNAESERSLEKAINELCSPEPLEFLPIARAHARTRGPMSSDSVLLLALSGKKAGQLVVLYLDAMGRQRTSGPPLPIVALMRNTIWETSIYAATCLTEFLAKLNERPVKEIPAWLAAIRDGETNEFRRWLESGGRFSDSFQEFYAPYPLSTRDYLAIEAPVAMLRELVADNIFDPKELLDKSLQNLMAVERFLELMPLLPKESRGHVFELPTAWDYPDLLERLAESGFDFNARVNNDGARPIHFAVRYGRQDAVKWLIQHGADVRIADKFQRNAFTWAESGPGFQCLPLLEGRDESPPPRAPNPDAPGIASIWNAAQNLPDGHGILVIIQIKTPPVTRVEKTYYRDECHYRLSFDVLRNAVTLNDLNSARQDYLFADEWPTFLFAPIIQWPDLTPLWETVEVREVDWTVAAKERKYDPPLRADLTAYARSALEQAFEVEEAAARQIQLRK